jgi:hypothetical protein
MSGRRTKTSTPSPGWRKAEMAAFLALTEFWVVHRHGLDASKLRDRALRLIGRASAEHQDFLRRLFDAMSRGRNLQ